MKEPSVGIWGSGTLFHAQACLACSGNRAPESLEPTNGWGSGSL